MTKKPAAKKAEPVFMGEGKSIDIQFHDVITVLAMINEYGQLDKLAARAKRQKLKVSIPSETVNSVKRFVAAHPEMSQHPIGKTVIRPAAEKVSKAGALTAAPAGDGYRYCCSFDPGG
jgi:hypothetical protein